MKCSLLILALFTSSFSLADAPTQVARLACVSGGNDLKDLSNRMDALLKEASAKGFTSVSAPSMTYRNGETVVCVIVSQFAPLR